MSKKKYNSAHGEKILTAEEYIAELVCENIAKRNRISLPNSYWSRPEWKEHFSKQRLLATGLLKLYPERAVISALKNPLAKNITTLGLQSVLDPVIKAEEAKLNHIQEISQLKKIQTVPTKQEPPRKPFGVSQSLLARLRSL